MKEKPNYYSIIPAPVRYSKIPDSAKLLYGEISSLTNQEGYCFATNQYFADLYGVHKKSISRNINILEKENFIDIELVMENNQVMQRRIYLKNFPQVIRFDNKTDSELPFVDRGIDKTVSLQVNSNGGMNNVDRGMDKIVDSPMDKIVDYNTTLFNTTSLIQEKNVFIKFLDSVKLQETEYKKLISAHGETAVKIMIEKLDAYKSSKNVKYKSDYKAILNWVVKWYKENHGENKQNYGAGDYSYEY